MNLTIEIHTGIPDLDEGKINDLLSSLAELLESKGLSNDSQTELKTLILVKPIKRGELATPEWLEMIAEDAFTMVMPATADAASSIQRIIAEEGGI